MLIREKEPFMKTRYLLLGVALATAVGVVQAQSANKQGKFDPYTEGAKSGKFDPYSEGAKSGKFDPYSEGAKSSDNVTSLNPGARTDQMEPIDNQTGTAQRASGKFDPYTEGAKSGKFDPYSEGANKQ
jgi:hypothetical protein